MGWWETLISVADFPARWHCGRWTEAHGWLHILSDLGVASAYFTIPCLLAYFVFRKKDVPFRKLFFLFSAFILFCGSTHLMEAVIFWWPAYRLAGLLKLATAIVSWTAVFALAGVVPQALRLRSPEELEREIEARKLAELHLQHLNEELERRVAAGVADLTAANVTLRAER
ncbi:MAG: hypothetical protein U5J83_01950 [Bryobacterales bacterium]|nr:hypothetical protein [Bryobacterales bacterium]